MKITVEVSNEFIEEGELVDSLKRQIIYDITQSIRTTVNEQVQKEIATFVRDTINATVTEQSRKTVAEFLETGTIIVSGKEVAVHEHLQQVFKTHSGWGNPTEQVKVLAEKWSKELKAKYDGAFVTQLVHRINLAGLLKPEVEKLLLADSTPR